MHSMELNVKEKNSFQFVWNLRWSNLLSIVIKKRMTKGKIECFNYNWSILNCHRTHCSIHCFGAILLQSHHKILFGKIKKENMEGSATNHRPGSKTLEYHLDLHHICLVGGFGSFACIATHLIVRFPRTDLKVWSGLRNLSIYLKAPGGHLEQAPTQNTKQALGKSPLNIIWVLKFCSLPAKTASIRDATSVSKVDGVWLRVVCNLDHIWILYLCSGCDWQTVNQIH